ncbi:MAG TPA: thioester domain-containing protein, partial [Lentzea sp.]
MASRLRIGAALLGATALLSMSTLAAAADVIVKPVPDKDQTDADKKYGYAVTIDKKTLPPGAKDEKEYGTLLIPLDLQENGKNSRVFAYCVELPTDLDHNKGLKEVDWDKHPGKYTHFKDNAGKILWILTNSFPTKTTNELDDLYKGDYDEEEAIAATQAAIWHFSDGIEITGATSGKKEAEADVVKLYKALIEQAKPIDQPNETPKLEIDPKSKSGKAGEKIGPFKVTTTATKLELTAQLPDGVTITDKNGNPLTTEKSGKE